MQYGTVWRTWHLIVCTVKADSTISSIKSHIYSSILMNSWENLCQIVGPSNFEVRKLSSGGIKLNFFIFMQEMK